MTHSNSSPEIMKGILQNNPLDRVILAVAGRFGDKSKEVERFLKFSVVGTVGAIVDFGTLNILQATIVPPTTDLNVMVAASVAFVVAVSSNFIWNRFWTYPDSRSRSIRRQLAQFAIVSVTGWLARTLWIGWSYLALGDLATTAIRLLNSGFTPSVEVAAKLGSNVALLIGIFVVLIWNFLANRYWTYNDVDKLADHRN